MRLACLFQSLLPEGEKVVAHGKVIIDVEV